jgi:hypothetical protein
MAAALATFVDLLAGDSTWRSKVLKIIQYVARLLISMHNEPTASRNLLARLALATAAPLPRLKTIASSISLARRMLYFGETLVYARDFFAELPPQATLVSLLKSGGRAPFLAALSHLCAGIAEDVSMSSRIGVIDSTILPPWFGRLTEVTWALQCFWYAYFALLKLSDARRVLAAQRREASRSGAGVASAPIPDMGDTQAPQHTAAAAIAAAERTHTLALLYAVKCVCDCTQAFPAACGIESWPERLEILSGLASALVNAYRTWYGATHPAPPPKCAPASA